MEKAKQYYLMVENKKVYVTEEVYKAYWQEINHENYLRKLDQKNQVVNFTGFKLLGSDRGIEESIVDENVDLERLIEFKESIEALHAAMDRLTPEEKELIKGLFFDEKTYRECAALKNTNAMNIYRKSVRILEKLKKNMNLL